MFTNEELKTYQALLKRCIKKGIVETSEIKPISIPLNNRKRWNKKSQNFENSAEFLAAKKELLGEFHKHESF